MTQVTRVAPEATTSRMFRIRGQMSRWVYPDPRLTPEHCEVLRDVNISERGVTQSRYGSTAYNSTALPGGEAAVGLWQGMFGANLKQVVVTPDKVYSDDGTTRVDITGSALTGGNDDRIQFDFIKSVLVMNNGVDAPRTWTGDDSSPVNTADLGGIPFTKSVCQMVHKNLLMYLGTTEDGTLYPTRVRWCDINRRNFTIDITSWLDANRYEIYDGGPAIIGAVDNWGTALVFKEDGVYPGEIFYDQLGFYDFRLAQPQRGFSPVAKHSIIARPEFVFGVAKEGIFVLRPDMSFEIVNTDDSEEWFNLNQSRLQYAQSWVREKDHQVRTLVSSSSNSSGHNYELVWDWQTGDLWIDRIAQTLSTARSIRISDVEYDWLGALNGMLYKSNDSTVNTDAGTAYTWRIKTAPNDLGLPGRSKHVLNIRTWYRKRTGASTSSFKVFIDEGRGSTESGQLTLDPALQWNTGLKWNDVNKWPGANLQRVDFFVNRIADTVAVEWTDSNPASLVGYQVEYLPLEG